MGHKNPKKKGNTKTYQTLGRLYCIYNTRKLGEATTKEKRKSIFALKIIKRVEENQSNKGDYKHESVFPGAWGRNIGAVMKCLPDKQGKHYLTTPPTYH